MMSAMSGCHLPYVVLPALDLTALGLGELDWFAIFVLAGIVVGVVVYDRAVARGGSVEAGAARTLPEVVVIGGLVGAHLLHVLGYHPELLREDPWVLVKIWRGMSSVGGFLGAALAAALWLKWRRQPFLPYADRLVFGLVSGWVFGRLGCATAHDHPGSRTDFFLGVAFPGGARHDLGLYELLFTLFVLVPVLWAIAARPWRSGMLLGVWLVLYGAVRFFLDFLRARDLDFVDARYLGLTPAQYVTVVMALLGVVVLARRPATLEPPLVGR